MNVYLIKKMGVQTIINAINGAVRNDEEDIEFIKSKRLGRFIEFMELELNVDIIRLDVKKKKTLRVHIDEEHIA